MCYCFFFKQKTSYEMRISDWSSDVCSSDLIEAIDLTLVDVPASRPIQMSFTTMQKQSYAIVQIRAGGLVGIGEGSSVGGPTWSSECAETIKVIIETYLAPLLIGKDATNLRELQHLMERARSEERRVGKECGSRCRSWWSR